MMKDRRGLVTQGLRSVPQAAKLKGNNSAFRLPFPVPRLGIWSLDTFYPVSYIYKVDEAGE